MGDLLENLPSLGNFAHAPEGRALAAGCGAPALYVCDHDTAPPPGQTIRTDPTNILIRTLTMKRTASAREREERRAADRAAAQAAAGAGGAAAAAVGAEHASADNSGGSGAGGSASARARAAGVKTAAKGKQPAGGGASGGGSASAGEGQKPAKRLATTAERAADRGKGRAGAAAAGGAAPTVLTEATLKSKTLTQLKALCKERELKEAGTRNDCTRRLLAAQGRVGGASGGAARK